jgi:hypothetical protein
MSLSSETTYRTANLTLASFLSHRGKQYTLVRGEGRSATWEFDGSQVVDLVATFESNEAAVEPQSFHHSITSTRRLLFDFINSGDECWEKEQIDKHEPSKGTSR